MHAAALARRAGPRRRGTRARAGPPWPRSPRRSRPRRTAGPHAGDRRHPAHARRSRRRRPTRPSPRRRRRPQQIARRVRGAGAAAGRRGRGERPPHRRARARRLEEEIARLTEARDTLNADVDALERFEQEYRERLRRAIEAELELLGRPACTARAVPRSTRSSCPPRRPPSWSASQEGVGARRGAVATRCACRRAEPRPPTVHIEAVPAYAASHAEPTGTPRRPAAGPTTAAAAAVDDRAELELPSTTTIDDVAHGDSLDDDAFFASLREAVRDDAPLGRHATTTRLLRRGRHRGAPPPASSAAASASSTLRRRSTHERGTADVDPTGERHAWTRVTGVARGRRASTRAAPRPRSTSRVLGAPRARDAHRRRGDRPGSGRRARGPAPCADR